MSDPRLTPDESLISTREPAQIAQPVANLMRRPGGPRDRQLLLGAEITVLGHRDGWAYVQADADGYCGHVELDAIATPHRLTHKIAAAASHAYLEADMKSADRVALSHGCRISALSETEKFIETPYGFVPRQHIAEIDKLADDPAQIAALFLGTPYLWGGNSRWGIDCSGLIQAACTACGIPCAGDSDLQEKSLGALMPDGTVPVRNDLLFWKGHVAMVWDPQTLIHANAHAMACVFEPLQVALARIAASDGPVTAHRRLVQD